MQTFAAFFFLLNYYDITGTRTFRGPRGLLVINLYDVLIKHVQTMVFFGLYVCKKDDYNIA